MNKAPLLLFTIRLHHRGLEAKIGRQQPLRSFVKFCNWYFTIHNTHKHLTEARVKIASGVGHSSAVRSVGG